MPDYVNDRKKQILKTLKELVLAHAPDEGETRVCGDALILARKNGAEKVTRCFTDPMASLVVQGDKRVVVGGREYRLGAGQCAAVCAGAPNSSFLINVTPQKPFLSLGFSLNNAILAELITEMRPEDHHIAGENHNFLITDASLDFMETLFRLATLIDKPERVKILAPLILRELHYLLLVGPPGPSLYNLYSQGRDHRILEAIGWLRAHLNQSVPIEKLARIAHMSVSSLHRHFKAITGFSPLQFHKQLRLYEAQRLMLAENERADLAALAVGYESVTQFNREYKRMFGAPPHRDVVARKRKLSS